MLWQAGWVRDEGCLLGACSMRGDSCVLETLEPVCEAWKATNGWEPQAVEWACVHQCDVCDDHVPFRVHANVCNWLGVLLLLLSRLAAQAAGLAGRVWSGGQHCSLAWFGVVMYRMYGMHGITVVVGALWCAGGPRAGFDNAMLLLDLRAMGL